MKVYVSVKAVRQFGRIIGVDSFDDAETKLLDLLDTIDEDSPARDEGHRVIYRVAVDTPIGRTRLELTVSRAARPEGDWNQLVNIRDKGRGTTRGTGRSR